MWKFSLYKAYNLLTPTKCIDVAGRDFLNNSFIINAQFDVRKYE